MSGAALFAGACTVAWGGCELWGLLIPLHRASFPSYMTRRATRGLGRIGVALAVVVAGAAGFGGTRGAALAASCGALLGWLLAAGREAWCEARAARNRAEG